MEHMQFDIIASAKTADARQVVLLADKVFFRINGECEYKEVAVTSEEYLRLWNAAHALDLVSGRALAPMLVPKQMAEELGIWVYVGPNFFGKTNVVLNLVSKRLPDLATLGMQMA